MADYKLIDLLLIYEGSNGDKTKALYEKLAGFGAAGEIGVNLFRAHKASARAKVYRGGERGRGSYRRMAYDRKEWSLDNLAKALEQHGQALGITWGWAIDAAQDYHRDVLYVDLPTGQVSFHTAGRGPGPDYAGAWDGVRNHGSMRICKFIMQILDEERALKIGRAM